VLHVDGRGVERPMTDALVRGIRLEVRPNLDQAEALAIAHASEAPQGGYARPPAAELVVYPETALQRRSGAAGGNAMDFAPRITRNHLAYHVRLELENGSRETRHDDYLVDANTGAILRKWSSLLTLAPAKGTPATTVGRSQYSGEVRLGSLSTACGYVMADPTRGNISTRDLAGGTEGDGVLYSNAEGRWGDGAASPRTGRPRRWTPTTGCRPPGTSTATCWAATASTARAAPPGTWSTTPPATTTPSGPTTASA